MHLFKDTFHFSAVKRAAVVAALGAMVFAVWAHAARVAKQRVAHDGVFAAAGAVVLVPTKGTIAARRSDGSLVRRNMRAALEAAHALRLHITN